MMLKLADLKRTVSRFAKDDGGNFAMIFGMTAATLFMAVGFGVNIAQSYEVKSSLREALDAALTSTARDITTGKIDRRDARATVERWLTANRDTRFVTSGTYALETLVVNDLTRTLDGTAVANVDLAFPLFGMKNPKVAVNSAATYSDRQIEVAMMLDVTGSMAGQKIEDLKTAAENAVKTMLDGQDPRNPRIRVSIVPYASGVNTGGLSASVFTEKAGGSNLPPRDDDALFAGLRLPRGVLPSFSDYTRLLAADLGTIQKCATERKTRGGAPDFSSDSPYDARGDARGKKYYPLINRDEGVLAGDARYRAMNKCPDAEIIPLTTDSEALLDSINKFEANGYTAGAIAIQWTYYMLSPKWRNFIKDSGLGDGPANRDDQEISKVAILMTDGQFNTAFAGVGSSYNGQGTKSRRNAESLCENMKSDGIEIFTIGFNLDDTDMSPTERDQAKAVLKNCSNEDTSALKHYYEASTGEELDRAFQSIIANTETVALVK